MSNRRRQAQRVAELAKLRDTVRALEVRLVLADKALEEAAGLSGALAPPFDYGMALEAIDRSEVGASYASPVDFNLSPGNGFTYGGRLRVGPKGNTSEREWRGYRPPPTRLDGRRAK